MPIRASRLLLAAAFLGACSTSDDLLRPPAVASVSITPGAFVMTIGQSRQMTAIVRDASGNLLIGRSVRWAVDDTMAARISVTGQLTGVGHGYVTITATSEGTSRSVAATIIPPETSQQ
jgi:hypothetical protein